MSTLATQSFLHANIACLGERNADLLEKLLAVDPHSGLSVGDARQGLVTGSLNGVQLCSRLRPLDEAERLVADMNLVEHAVIVVLGFGLGHHVRALAQRSRRATLIVVFEPDLALLRAALEQVDHTSWLREALLVFVTDADDRGALARSLDGSEAILAQGVQVLEHPPSRQRLGDDAARFSATFTQFVSAAKTTLMTTLVRSVDTARNLLLNIDHYAAGPGLADLHNAAARCPAVVVAAGPSLYRNVDRLAAEGVRDRCIIIAAQTTLKPLLQRGIRPHFVTALDYHEISRRFYEGLEDHDLADVTLIADPKANPVILDSFPGPVRCCASGFLDTLLASMKRPMGELPAGATVAHLSVYLARFLGCDPIALVGQDLGFTDGLYYAPGAAIHEVWAPELNPFNTIAMMEWQRIARHRLHLHATIDANGRPIFSDAQMRAYLQQFERDFARYRHEGVRIIDCTEGGVPKQHAQPMPLADFLAQHAVRPLAALPCAARAFDASRLAAARIQSASMRTQVRELARLSRSTARLLRSMIRDQRDQARMNDHFAKIDRNRRAVEQRMQAFDLLNQMNQLGVFKRFKADRRIHMLEGDAGADALAGQRAQLDRDLENVVWLADAGDELVELLRHSEDVLQDSRRGRPSFAKRTAGCGSPTTAAHRPGPLDSTGDREPAPARARRCRVAALVPIDPHRNGLGIKRSLAEPFGDRTVLQATLERLGRSRAIESIILLAPEQFDLDALIDRDRIGLPVEIERCAPAGGSPFGPEQAAIAAARLWAVECWRGGVAGMSVYDEVLCPQVMHAVMERRGLTAAIIAGPDWPFIDVSAQTGCDAIVNRHREHGDQHNLVFTQAPPGLCGCLVSAKLMSELAQRNRLATVGGLLVYQPHAPQHDPVARDANVQVDHRVRQCMVRATFDSPRQRALMRRALQSLGPGADSLQVVQTVESARADMLADPAYGSPFDLPQHVVLELCATRPSSGVFGRAAKAGAARPPMDPALADQILQQLRSADDVAITLAGAGDPLEHPRLDSILAAAARSDGGAPAHLHLRTELACGQDVVGRLVNAPAIDIISVDLNADRAATYRSMMGDDRFAQVLKNIEWLVEHRQRFTAHSAAAAMARPWIVPRIQRREETAADIDTFFDRWQHTLGAAVIDDPRSWERPSALIPASTPQRVARHERLNCMTILSDGSVSLENDDITGASSIGSARERPLRELWRELLRRRLAADHAP